MLINDRLMDVMREKAQEMNSMMGEFRELCSRYNVQTEEDFDSLDRLYELREKLGLTTRQN